MKAYIQKKKKKSFSLLFIVYEKLISTDRHRWHGEIGIIRIIAEDSQN